MEEEDEGEEILCENTSHEQGINVRRIDRRMLQVIVSKIFDRLRKLDGIVSKVLHTTRKEGKPNSGGGMR
jgi:hypothetical protein